MNKELASFLSDLCMELDINTAHDYDGVESEEDIEIYKKSVIRNIRTMAKQLKTQEAYNQLWQHIGHEQISDIHQMDEEMGETPSKGEDLVRALIENACNQTGILLNPVEAKDFFAKVHRIYG